MSANLSALLQSGQNHHHAGRLDQAEGCYRQVLSELPGEPSALYLMGMLDIQRGRPESAERFLRSAIAGNPKQPRFFIYLADILRKQNKIEEALKAMVSAIEQIPTAAELHDALGVLLEAKGLSAESLRAYQRAVACDPNFAPGRLNIAVHNIRQGEYAEAITQCRWRWRFSRNRCRPAYCWRRRLEFEAARGSDRPPARRSIARWEECQDHDGAEPGISAGGRSSGGARLGKARPELEEERDRSFHAPVLRALGARHG